MFLSSGAVADLPGFYGQKIARKDQTWLDVRSPMTTVPPVSGDTQLENTYQRQLDKFESAEGPYAGALAEPLVGLGRYHAQRGDYEEAVHLYRRALHLVRLNEGLYSERQAPIVRELLTTVRATGDLDALDDRYDYFFRLYGNGQPPHTDVRLRATLEYMRWQREALRLGIGGTDFRRLLDLYKLNENMLEVPGVYTPDVQWRLVLGQLRNLYLIQERVVPRIVVSSAGSSTSSAFKSVSAIDGELNMDQRSLENIQRNALRRGKQLLEYYIASAETGSVASDIAPATGQLRARAVLELGDWYQWNGSYHRASDYYATAISMLEDAGEMALLHNWFGAPVELPDNGAYWQPPEQIEGEMPSIVAATYDVSARGRAKNISVEVSRPEDQRRMYRFKRELANTRFRPRYDKGTAVPAHQLTREYNFYD